MTNCCSERPRTISPSASWTTSPTPRWPLTRSLISNRKKWCARSSSDSAPTAPSEPTRTPSRSSARKPTLYAQGYFVYDSKKSGAVTISHLRFGPSRSIPRSCSNSADFVACHQCAFLERYNVVGLRARGGRRCCSTRPSAPTKSGTIAPGNPEAPSSPRNSSALSLTPTPCAKAAGMGGRINTIMQTCFFAISNVLPREEAIAQIKKSIKKTYARKGQAVVDQNFAAVDQTLAALHEVKHSQARFLRSSSAAECSGGSARFCPAGHGGDAGQQGRFAAGQRLPCGWHLALRHHALGKTRHRPGNSGLGFGHLHSMQQVRPGLPARGHPGEGSSAGLGRQCPGGFKSVKIRGQDAQFTSRCRRKIAPVARCACRLPGKIKTDPRRKAMQMEPMPLREQEKANYEFFLLPSQRRPHPPRRMSKAREFREPLFEYSGACSGCGETPYVKLLTQMSGDRLIIANATGCSSIYGGNLPTTPLHRQQRRTRPGLVQFALRGQRRIWFRPPHRLGQANRIRARTGAQARAAIGRPVGEAILRRQTGRRSGDCRPTRARRATARAPATIDSPEASRLHALADALVKKSVWVVGGDGWAYDIGFGGLDHVIAMNEKVNILVLDTEVYSNTGGQKSKATPRGAAARFAVAGKSTAEEGPGPDRDELRHRLRCPGRLRRQGFPDRQSLGGGRSPTPALRSSSPTALASRTVTACATAWNSKSWPWKRASGRSTVSIRAGSKKAWRLCRSTTLRPNTRRRTICATNCASG